jgi:hypothetical protein
MEQRSSHWTDFHEILYLSSFQKSVKKFEVPLKLNKNNGQFYMKVNVHFWSYLIQFSSEWEMFQTKVFVKIKTHI